MLKEFVQDLLIRSADCDRFGRLTPAQMLVIMQEMAGEHSHLLGMGREAMLNEHAIWILTRSEVHIARYPLYLEKIRVRTFPGALRRLLFPRFFTFEAENGQPVITASSYWALMDIRTGTMVLPPSVLPLLPDTADMRPPIGYPSSVKLADAPEEASLYTPAYTDLDLNGHVNNTRCADWICNLLSENTLKDRPIETLVINYDREIRGNEPLTFSFRKNERDFSLRCLRDGTAHVDVGGTMALPGTMPPSPLAAL